MESDMTLFAQFKSSFLFSTQTQLTLRYVWKLSFIFTQLEISTFKFGSEEGF